MHQVVDLNQLEEYASLFLTITEISYLMGIDSEHLRREIRHGKSDIAIAYQRGKLKSIVDIRKQQLAFAKKGSPTAENLMNGYMIKQQKDE
ncbi:MAG TPA: hypothetical protein PKE03_10310 [Bacteroidales bacterium]|nr:hypothetical protein [Bacteroidales bacterium]